MREIRSQKETEAAFVNLIGQVKETYLDEQPLVVGIHTGGAWIASRICEQLHWDEPATLDISLYRDDFETSGLKRAHHVGRTLLGRGTATGRVQPYGARICH